MASINEQVALLTALQKVVKERLNLARAEADEAMIEAYEEDGVVKKALKIGGVKVGDYSVVLTSDEWEITDAAAFEEFALSYGFGNYHKEIIPAYMAQAVAILEEEAPECLTEVIDIDPKWSNYVTNVAGVATLLDSGEPIPGLKYTGPRVKCTQVRGCKPEDVVPVLQRIGGIDQLLLGPANEDTNAIPPQEG